MPQKEIDIKNWVLDPATGYLTSFDKRNKFTAQVKAEFLKLLLLHRDIERALNALGLSRRPLTAHLRADARFKADYTETVRFIKDPEKIKWQEVVDRLWTRHAS